MIDYVLGDEIAREGIDFDCEGKGKLGSSPNSGLDKRRGGEEKGRVEKNRKKEECGMRRGGRSLLKDWGKRRWEEEK